MSLECKVVFSGGFLFVCLLFFLFYFYKSNVFLFLFFKLKKTFIVKAVQSLCFLNLNLYEGIEYIKHLLGNSNTLRLRTRKLSIH